MYVYLYSYLFCKGARSRFAGRTGNPQNLTHSVLPPQPPPSLQSPCPIPAAPVSGCGCGGSTPLAQHQVCSTAVSSISESKVIEINLLGIFQTLRIAPFMKYYSA